MNPIKNHSSAGFTLIETLVSVGILALIVGSVGTVVFQTTKMQAGIEDRSAANEFIASLSKQLTTNEGCKGILGGKVLPGLAGDPLVIPAAIYKGYGSKAGVDIAAGFPVSPRISVKTLSIKNKNIPIVSGKTSVDLGGVLGVQTITYNRIVAQIQIQLQSRIAGEITELPIRYIEVPIITHTGPPAVMPPTNHIDDCTVIASAKDACDTIGGTFDSATSTCTPGTSCTIVGRIHGCTISVDPSCSGFAYSGSTVFSSNPSASTSNPTVGCPIGSTPVTNGTVDYIFTTPGSKGAGTTPATAYLYNCLQCL